MQLPKVKKKNCSIFGKYCCDWSSLVVVGVTVMYSKLLKLLAITKDLHTLLCPTQVTHSRYCCFWTEHRTRDTTVLNVHNYVSRLYMQDKRNIYHKDLYMHDSKSLDDSKSVYVWSQASHNVLSRTYAKHVIQACRIHKYITFTCTYM